MISRKRIFRAQALEQYARSREKDILPRSAAPPVLLFFWILLGLLLVSTLLAWQVQVPTYTAASGFIVQSGRTTMHSAGQSTALLFVPATASSALSIGQAITLQVTLTGEDLTGTIVTVDSAVITPEEARQQYTLTGDLALVITRPSRAVTVTLMPPLPPDVFADSTVIAQIPAGTRSVLTLLPDLLNGFFGD